MTQDEADAAWNRAVLEAHYREYPEARPERWEIALATAKLAGHPLAAQPELVRRAADELVQIVADPSPDEVLAYAVALGTPRLEADNLMLVKELTDAEVARRFSAVLDDAENGEAVAITRDGRRIAMLVPAPRANGAALLDVFRRWDGQLAADDTFDADVAAARDLPPGPDADPWHE